MQKDKLIIQKLATILLLAIKTYRPMQTVVIQNLPRPISENKLGGDKGAIVDLWAEISP